MASPAATLAAFQPNWLEILQTGFIRNAFLGGTVVALMAGLVGYFVVMRRSAFAAHALAHIGFPGATGAVLIGLPVTLGLATFCVLGALAIAVLGRRAAEREVATGTVLAFAAGLGILFASQSSRNASTVTSILFGNLLAITPGQLWVFAAFGVVIAVTMVVVFRALLFASIDGDVAAARGVPVRALGTVFLVVLALTTTMAVQVVGTLLLFALVVTPAATGIMLSGRPWVAVALATTVSVLSVWIGLVLSAMFDLPPSFAIVTVACAVWLVTWLVCRDDRGVVERGVDDDAHHPAAAGSVVA